MKGRVTKLERNAFGSLTGVKLVFGHPGKDGAAELLAAVSPSLSAPMKRGADLSEADFLVDVALTAPGQVDYGEVPDQLLKSSLQLLVERIKADPGFTPEDQAILEQLEVEA